MFEHRWLTGGGILSWGQSIIGIREVGLSRQANGTQPSLKKQEEFKNEWSYKSHVATNDVPIGA